MIDTENLTNYEILDLIDEHELNITQTNGEIRVAGYQEGGEISIQTKIGGIRTAIKEWAEAYNEVIK